MAANLLSFTDSDGNAFDIYEDKIVSAYDSGTNPVVSYKKNVDGIVFAIEVTDASFTASIPSFRSLVPVSLAGNSSPGVEYINVDRVALIEANGSNTFISYDNGAAAEKKEITGTVADFISLVATSTVEMTVTLTSAQILALNTTPIELVPAPGASKYLILESATPSLDFNTTAYAAGGDFVISPTGTSANAVASIPEAFVESSADAVQNNTILFNVAAGINTPLVIGALTSDPTLGDSEIKINLRYRVGSF